MEKVLFREEQRHNQWWLWLLLIAAFLSVLIPFSYGIYSQEVLNVPYGDNPMSTEGLIVTGIFSVLLFGFVIFIVFRLRLIIKITSEGLFYSYPPLARKMKKITPGEIEHYEVKTFRSSFEFGGHGLKRRRRFGQVYMMAGKTGLLLKLKNGKKILLGTQKKQALEYAMEKLMASENM